MALAGRLLGRWSPRRRRPRRQVRVGTPAALELWGATPAGAPRQVILGDQRTVLFFLTSSCYGCRPLWAQLGEPDQEQGPPAVARLLLVTPSPSTESARDVAALAPAGLEVLMSSEAWHAFGVTAAPWFTVVERGLIAAEGPAPTGRNRVQLLVAGPPE